MFTGLIETVGRVERSAGRQGNRVFTLQALFAGELKLGESVAVNGCCLTVTKTDKKTFDVEAVAATLEATTLGRLQTGDAVNLERALRAGDRMGGHFVQGHVDEVGKVRRIERHSGYWVLAVETDRRHSRPLVEKGSVCVDGISLTVASVRPGEFAVNIIPHTWENTSLKQRRAGDKVNIEYDLLVKAVRQAGGQEV
ncbi:riboflavin synthase [candidate division WOR-3 bacterium]|uniref:Riboflavin synthase n=1 Tax=candidate division WOR-3 bacterium TaxID=2052148 RepID=A0A938BU93_UNCW3|nr:riboflavin synthase [candidate division WOR-3 bacterium]